MQRKFDVHYGHKNTSNCFSNLNSKLPIKLAKPMRVHSHADSSQYFKGHTINSKNPNVTSLSGISTILKTRFVFNVRSTRMHRYCKHCKLTMHMTRSK